MTEVQGTVVVADANVLINLIHTGRLDLCAGLPDLEFLIPEHVNAEITRPEQRAALDAAIEAGIFRVVPITDPEAIRALTLLLAFLGRGEAACLVLAERNGWSIASDERGRFRREVLARMDETRLFGTAEIYVRSIQEGLLTVEQADADKLVLERHRFKMSFGSFRELLEATQVQEKGVAAWHDEPDTTSPSAGTGAGRSRRRAPRGPPR